MKHKCIKRRFIVKTMLFIIQLCDKTLELCFYQIYYVLFYILYGG